MAFHIWKHMIYCTKLWSLLIPAWLFRSKTERRDFYVFAPMRSSVGEISQDTFGKAGADKKSLRVWGELAQPSTFCCFLFIAETFLSGSEALERWSHWFFPSLKSRSFCSPAFGLPGISSFPLCPVLGINLDSSFLWSLIKRLFRCPKASKARIWTVTTLKGTLCQFWPWHTKSKLLIFKTNSPPLFFLPEGNRIKLPLKDWLFLSSYVWGF